METKHPVSRIGRKGFTLVEVLVSSAILATVLSVVLSVFIASQRLLEKAMADVQISLELRLLREKLLFHVDENGGLMNARRSSLFTGGGENELSYIPFPLASDSARVIALEPETGKLSAEGGGGWLSTGCIAFDPDAASPFSYNAGTGELRVDADVKVENGSRVVGRQRQIIRSQVMSK